jgi:hypothetical protein
MKNWKTTGTGIVGLIGIIWKAVSTKTIGPEDVTAVITAIGLIFAKDAGVSGNGF